MKPNILVVDIMKMCMWVFDDPRINFQRVTAFELSHFRQVLYCWVWSLCNQLLPKFSVDIFQTLQTYCGRIEDGHVVDILWTY